jgi:hypothetical protein
MRRTDERNAGIGLQRAGLAGDGEVHGILVLELVVLDKSGQVSGNGGESVRRQGWPGDCR